MPGTYGRPWSPLADVYGKQWAFSPRTSDPSGTEQGDMWLRTDLDSGDKLATLRFDHGSGVWDVPVFPTGTSESGVEEVLRVQTPNGLGFVPILDNSPAFSQLGFQHAGTRYGLHDSVNAIPDSAIAHYDATELSLSDGDSVSTWSDQTGNGYDLTAGTAPTYKTGIINGNPVVRFDGVDDFLDVAFSTISQPNHIFIVVQYRSVDSTSSGNQYTFDSDDSNNRELFRQFEGNWGIFAGSNLFGSAADTSAHIGTALYNGSSSSLRIDGADDATGDAGADGLGGLTVGSSSSDSDFGPVDIGEIVVCDGELSTSDRDAEESRLAEKWGISIA